MYAETQCFETSVKVTLKGWLVMVDLREDELIHGKIFKFIFFIFFRLWSDTKTLPGVSIEIVF